MLIPTRTQRLAQKHTDPAPPAHPHWQLSKKETCPPVTSTIRLSSNEWKVLTGQNSYLVVRAPDHISYCSVCGSYSDAATARTHHTQCGPNALNTFAPKEQFFDVRQPLLNPVNQEIIWLLKPGLREKVGGPDATHPESHSPSQS